MNFLGLCHDIIFNVIKPITKALGKLHFPYTRKKITGKDYYTLFPLLKPGTILLSRTEGELTTFLIPGFWKHAVIYTPKSDQPVDELISEAEGIGVVETDLITFLLKKDYVIALEPLFLGDQKDLIMKKSADLANEQIGKPYDYDFSFQVSNNKTFYCSELVWWSYDEACRKFGKVSPFVPKKTIGIDTITPTDIANAMDKFVVIWDSRKKST